MQLVPEKWKYLINRKRNNYDLEGINESNSSETMIIFLSFKEKLQ